MDKNVVKCPLVYLCDRGHTKVPYRVPLQLIKCGHTLYGALMVDEMMPSTANKI